MKIEVKSKPIPQGRPRFHAGHAYQPARSREYREEVSWASRLAMRGRNPLKGALKVKIEIYRREPPTSRNYGDIDNHLKSLFDGMNQIVYEDDRQIVDCHVVKLTSKEERVVIELSSV